MKYLLILITFLSLALQLHAQKWGNPTAKWFSTYQWGFNYPSTGLIKIEKDTVIQGKTCVQTGIYQPDYSYLSGDTVYFLKNDTFRATYYFAAQVGDTISFYNQYECDSSLTVYGKVDSVDSINVGNKFIKKFIVSVLWKDSGSWYQPKSFTYYENAGASNFIYPRFECVIDAELFWLCNYGDSSIQDFWLFPNRNCDTATAIAETEKLQAQHHWQSANVLSISPDEACNLTLFNIAGQPVIQQKLNPGENRVPINQPSALYIALLQTKESYRTIKLYKQTTY